MNTIIINGDKWIWNVLNIEDYETKHSNEGPSTAICDETHKEIDFREDNFNMDVILHEVTHAYQSYLCLENTNKVDPDDYCEIHATFMEKYGLKVVASSLHIYSKYLEKKNVETLWKKILKLL